MAAMSETEENFAAKFHNLPGTTVKEKQRNLFRLLRQQSFSAEDLDDMITNLKPTNHLEKIFHTDVLIHFRRFDELYQQYLNGDGITVSKVSKHDWFYKQAFEEMSPEDFVNRFLPNVSYSLKAKILKKLPFDENRTDEVFDFLQKKYGLSIANVVLHKCTSEKIREILINHPVERRSSQLKAIHKKDPDLIYVYIEERSKQEGNSDFLNYDCFLAYIAQKDPEMFHCLFNKYKFTYISLGRRTTKSYIASQRDRVLDKREIYFKILHKRAFVRKLGTEMSDILFKSMEDGYRLQYWQYMLEYFPKKHQFDIYKTNYNLAYYRKFGKNIDAVLEEVVRIMPDPIEREKFARLKLEKDGDKDYLKYFTTATCLKEFMDKVDHLTLLERGNYVKIFTECCILNDDLDGLLKLLELLCVRFRNDGTEIRDSFFYTSINSNGNFLSKLTEQHWNLIMELFGIMNARNEEVFCEGMFRVRYLHFLVNNEGCVKDAIVKCSKWPEFICSSYIEESHLHAVLKELVEVGLPKTNTSTENYSAKYDCMLAHLCKAYNKRYPEDVINVHRHQRILQSVKHLLGSEISDYLDTECISGVEYVLCSSNLLEEFAELKEMYFTAFRTFGRLSGVTWFLKNDPETLKNNLNGFLQNFHDMEVPESLWRYMKKYAHLGLDTAIVEFCKSKLKDDDYQHKNKVIKVLSILLTPDSYLEYMNSYFVTSTESEGKNEHSVHKLLMKYMHGVHAPAKVLPVALDFCKGANRRYVLGPLYSCFYNLPEDETRPFIDILSNNNAVSVNKHAMYLKCILYDVDTAYNSLNEATGPILKRALKYFARNPSDLLWQLIESKIGVAKNKEQVLKFAIAKVEVPKGYTSQYYEAMWKVLDTFENRQIKETLITKMEQTSVHNLNPEFAFRIICDNIFTVEHVNDLIANILINLDNNEKFEEFSRILREWKEKSWDGEEKRVARQNLNMFMFSLFEKYMVSEDVNNEFVSAVSAAFKSVFSISEAFQECVLISCMAFKGNTVENSAQLLTDLNNCIEEEFGHFAVRLVADIIKSKVFRRMYKDRSEQLQLCYSLLKIRKSVNDSLLVLMLLPETRPEGAENFTLYTEILNELSAIEDSYLQLQLNLYLMTWCNESAFDDAFY